MLGCKLCVRGRVHVSDGPVRKSSKCKVLNMKVCLLMCSNIRNKALSVGYNK